MTDTNPNNYIVLDNDKKAKYPECSVHKSWDKCEFVTWDEACEYAHKWLGEYSPGVDIMIGEKPHYEFSYSGYGDKLTITKINSN